MPDPPHQGQPPQQPPEDLATPDAVDPLWRPPTTLETPKRGSSSSGFAMGLIFGAGGIVAVLFGALLVFGVHQLGAEVKAALNANAVAREQMGEVRSCTVRWFDQSDDNDLIRYDCECERGRAVFELNTESTGPGGAEELVEGVLVDGDERIDLLPK
jgi:hypothetical protein